MSSCGHYFDNRNLTSVPHLAGTPQDLEQAVLLRDQFLEYGLDQATVIPYRVLLSYPDMEKPNKVYLLDSNGQANFTTEGKQKPLYAQEEYSDLVAPNFNAYSGTGTKEAVITFILYQILKCSVIATLMAVFFLQGWPGLRILWTRSSLRLFSRQRNQCHQ